MTQKGVQKAVKDQLTDRREFSSYILIETLLKDKCKWQIYSCLLIENKQTLLIKHDIVKDKSRWQIYS